MFVEYQTNNSGGSWWLTDEHWKALESAGWTVNWGSLYFCHSKLNWPSKKSLPDVCPSDAECPGHRCFESWQDMAEEDRWLGALAREATKEFPDLVSAIREFESITGQDATDEGCNCCGAPHTFLWGECIRAACGCKGPHRDYHFGSGEDLLAHMFPNKNTDRTKRQLLEDAA